MISIVKVTTVVGSSVFTVHLNGIGRSESLPATDFLSGSIAWQTARTPNTLVSHTARISSRDTCDLKADPLVRPGDQSDEFVVSLLYCVVAWP